MRVGWEKKLFHLAVPHKFLMMVGFEKKLFHLALAHKFLLQLDLKKKLFHLAVAHKFLLRLDLHVLYVSAPVPVIEVDSFVGSLIVFMIQRARSPRKFHFGYITVSR